ncbi:hypothetical protein PCHDK_000568800 [Plasmodium chabaudi adami]|uniref:Fam-a protein n=1 Tax=Plasmodium chabaudi adami TaxID=5826 RepID=A0A1D3LD11_PLACE|nr:hypothetical protein PCHDK_000568800 [Plasmodium chabaudi adami]
MFFLQIKNNSTLINSSSNESHEKGSILTYPDPEETEKAAEIMDEIVYRLKRYANFNNGLTHYYEGGERKYSYFTEYEDDIYGLRLHLKIPNPNKYNEIINELNKFKDVYRLGYYAKDVRKYYSNLILLHRHDQQINEESNENYFYLSATVELSEDMTIISSTSIDLNKTGVDKIIGQKNTAENPDMPKDHIDWSNVGREIVLNKNFAYVFGFLIKRESDHVGITYIEYKFDDIYCSNRTHLIKCVRHKANLVTNKMVAILKPFSD